MVKAKQRVYNDLYVRLDSKDGETDLCMLVRQQDRDERDVMQAGVIQDRDGHVLTSAISLMGRW